MKKTHENVQLKIGQLDKKINEIVNEVNIKNDLNIDQIIDYGKKLKRLNLMRTTLILTYIPTDNNQ